MKDIVILFLEGCSLCERKSVAFPLHFAFCFALLCFGFALLCICFANVRFPRVLRTLK